MIVIDCVWLIRVSSYRRYSLTMEKLGMLCAYDIITPFILPLNSSSLYLYKFIIVDFTDSNSAHFIKQGRMRITSWENLPCTIYPAKLFSFVDKSNIKCTDQITHVCRLIKWALILFYCRRWVFLWFIPYFICYDWP